MSGAKLAADFWLTEYITPYEVMHHGLSDILISTHTNFQHMCIGVSGTYGKALLLDGKWQSCVGDEFIYHEALVQPACILQGGPKRILVLGGGEGATIREALRWKTAERVVMVDLDGEVVEACKELLPEMHQGAFDDPRMELVVSDALEYLRNSDHEWDVIISDLTDPMESGLSFQLFTKEYFQLCRNALRPGGILSLQSGTTAPTMLTLHARVVNTLAAVFPHVEPYQILMPSYSQPWGFTLASDSPLLPLPSAEEVDRLLAEQVTGRLKTIDGRSLSAVVNTAPYVRDAVEAETTVYTLAAPPVETED